VSSLDDRLRKPIAKKARDGVIGCPHQEGIDYEGEWCPDPRCAFWKGRDRFTGELLT
jgi:hypothetical protein